jgi:hypothetical protein
MSLCCKRHAGGTGRRPIVHEVDGGLLTCAQHDRLHVRSHRRSRPGTAGTRVDRWSEEHELSGDSAAAICSQADRAPETSRFDRE